MKFSQKFLRIGDFEKLSFFESAILIFFSKKKNFFCFTPMKISHKLCVRMDETQFLWLWWFTAKNDPYQTFLGGVYSRLYQSCCSLCRCFLSCLFLVFTLRHTCARAVSVVNSEWHTSKQSKGCMMRNPPAQATAILRPTAAACCASVGAPPRHARAIVLPLLLPAPVWIWQFSDSKQSERTGLLR